MCSDHWARQNWQQKIIGIEENESAKATIFMLLQQEQFAEEMKSLNAGKDPPEGS